jgi:hypothetical protein
MNYEVWATRIDGLKVLVALSICRIDLRSYKQLLLMRSIEFDETTRLYQYQVRSK